MENYIYNINKDENLNLYFSLKGKHDLNISEDEKNKFINEVSKKIKELSLSFDTIIYPESSSDLIEKVAVSLNKDIIVIKKNSLSTIRSILTDMKFSKQEMSSQIKRISEMTESFKIHKIKYNQRHKYAEYLFEKIELKDEEKTLFIDDSYFSGSTFKAIKSIYPEISGIFIFKNVI